MARWSKSRGNKSWLRLLKQAKASKIELREYGVKPLRFNSRYDQTFDGIWWELPDRYMQRSWKKFRKTQYKTKIMVDI